MIPERNLSNNKLGRPGKIIQVDETMLNCKCKSHLGRTPSNKFDSLCIVKVESKIIRAYSSTLPTKGTYNRPNYL
ncbi:hypothetical protein H312_01679 [Anncaliia algerae PRA339]|uniref:Uncharacterized protein n=1 Tax=Anncaliia algerae PRA339 TaxID=1288291 RepID=A0A059F1Q1_9MICR|nr:hypothetical protein H312_01679 [Anncaliia algerae PRA339]